MLAYRTPGVYFEWLDQRGPAMAPLRTDIAGFVGIAMAGPLHIPVKIESFTQFVSIFGGHTPQGFLAYAVEGFFANGGQTCWIVRVADPDPKSTRAASVVVEDVNEKPALRLSAVSRFSRSDGTADKKPNRGRRGEDITFRLTTTAPDRFTLIVTLDNTREIWRDLSLSSGDARNAKDLINDPSSGSRLVEIEILSSTPTFPLDVVGRLKDGSDGLRTLKIDHFTGTSMPGPEAGGLAALELIDEISIVAIPDIMRKPPVTPHETKPRPPDCNFLNRDEFKKLSEKPLQWQTRDCCRPEIEAAALPAEERQQEMPRAFSREEVQELQRALIAHCERLKDRVAVLDTPLVDPATGEEMTPELAKSWRLGLDTKYGALYFPWLRVPDPLQLEGQLRSIPPSGHVAGIYAKGDRLIGVHKPPANEELESVKDVQVVLDDIAHGALNDAGINVIRDYRGRGVRVAGARTLSSDTEWRYVNVRRLLIMIEEAIDEQTQWTVFEPNNPDVWRSIDRVVRAFLDRLWRRGMLDGATPDAAYSVRCDETTNPPEETARGRVICEVGVLPPWPAEFVVVRIGRTEGATEILERET